MAGMTTGIEVTDDARTRALDRPDTDTTGRDDTLTLVPALDRPDPALDLVRPEVTETEGTGRLTAGFHHHPSTPTATAGAALAYRGTRAKSRSADR